MSDLRVNKIQPVPANYAEANGTIVIEAQGGKKPYKYSIDNGISYSNNAMFDNIHGGTYFVVVKDANNDATISQEVIVPKTLSNIQAIFLDNLYDNFGNESQAAMQTVHKFTDARGETITTNLLPRVAKGWKTDPDFAAMVSDIKLDSNSYQKDYYEAKLMQHINGGIPIIQWVAAPARKDELGNILNPSERIPIQVGQTLPSEKSLHFVLERKFKDDYSLRQEITGANGSGKLIALMLDAEFTEEGEVEEETENE